MNDFRIKYKPTIDGDLMQIVDGKEVGTLGVQLSPDTADLFARAPEMSARLAAVEAERDEARRIAAFVAECGCDCQSCIDQSNVEDKCNVGILILSWKEEDTP